jgi:hypothetical protein
MFGRSPQARCVLDGKHEYAEAIEGAQCRTVIGGDMRHGLRHRHGNVSENEPDQNPVDSARRRLPTAPVLEDLERALADSLTFWPAVHGWCHGRKIAIAAQECATGFPAQREF